MAAGPRQAASYVQFITEEDSGWATGPATASEDLGQGQSTSMEERPYKGPLNWFPDRCCRMEGLELAASPSFLQTTCGQRRDVSGRPTEPARWPVQTFCLIALQSHYVPRATGQEGKLRPRDTQTRSLHIHPHGHTCHPEQVTPGVQARPCGCPVEPMDSGGGLRGFRRPTPQGALVQPL